MRKTMLDSKFIREYRMLVQNAIEDKGVDLDLEELLSLDDKRRELQQEVEDIRRQRKEYASYLKGELSEEEKQEYQQKGKELKKELQAKEDELNGMEERFQTLMYHVPNIYSEDSPVGEDDSANVTIKTVGDVPEFSFEPADHIQLGENLGLIDFESGVNISGSRGYVLTNEAVNLHYALLWYSLQHMQKRGFMPVSTPTIVKGAHLYSSGHFPTEKDEAYKVEDASTERESRYLAGTSEIAILGMYQNAVFAAEDLPKRVSAISPCYRSEVGSYGKDTQGLYRMHEFMKVEQFVISPGNVRESDFLHHEMLTFSEEIMRALELPYRVVQVSTGDMGPPKYKQYDIETWMPSRNDYGETHSTSNITDWQARRANIKYVAEDGKKYYAHTLNNTAIASPRMLIAILENYQNADGSVTVPEVLRPYVGKERIAVASSE
ncbi:MAG: serine--tRNA ligase [Parcubacteria group bacterium SW_4_49_11]|nr:MAG: serine--tRNA ligase [Parcubacteria group bacterium SW_4_49_11]